MTSCSFSAIHLSSFSRRSGRITNGAKFAITSGFILSMMRRREQSDAKIVIFEKKKLQTFHFGVDPTYLSIMTTTMDCPGSMSLLHLWVTSDLHSFWCRSVSFHWAPDEWTMFALFPCYFTFTKGRRSIINTLINKMPVLEDKQKLHLLTWSFIMCDYAL